MINLIRNNKKPQNNHSLNATRRRGKQTLLLSSRTPRQFNSLFEWTEDRYLVDHRLSQEPLEQS